MLEDEHFLADDDDLVGSSESNSYSQIKSILKKKKATAEPQQRTTAFSPQFLTNNQGLKVPDGMPTSTMHLFQPSSNLVAHAQPPSQNMFVRSDHGLGLSRIPAGSLVQN